MKKLVIERDKWLHGEGDDSYLLRTRDEKMCCLGFYCLSLGIPEKEIQGTPGPSSLIERTSKGHPARALEQEDILGNLVDVDSRHADSSPSSVSPNTVCNALMAVNDHMINPGGDNYAAGHVVPTEKERERIIQKLFREIDVEVEFVSSPEYQKKEKLELLKELSEILDKATDLGLLDDLQAEALHPYTVNYFYDASMVTLKKLEKANE